MNEKPLTEEQKALAEYFLKPFDTPQEMRDWMLAFFGIDFPDGFVDDGSNSSPVDWMFEAYTSVRFNKGEAAPVWIVYSSRDSYKTLSCSAFEVIVMIHFGVTVAHMAAIKSQSAKAIQYINNFVRLCKPYFDHHNFSLTSQSKSKVEMTDKDGNSTYMTVIVCTLQGANSEHTNLMVVDEVDVVQYPQAFEEAKMIPGVLHGRYPMTIMTSTRKFAFGLMQKEITKAQKLNRPIKNWNIIDITEKCLPERHKPEEPKVKRFINKSLPLRQITEEAFLKIPVEDRERWEEIEAYSGCTTCKLLPVCKMKLAHRRETDVGGLYKPIPFTMNQFDTIEPDMAEAQLLCWKPSAAGLVYGRFDETEGANTLSLESAWYNYTGQEPFEGLTLDHLIDEMHRNGVKFYVGGDWGFRHLFALIAGAILPSGEFWVFETFGMSGLEFDDMMKYSKIMRDKYLPKRWYMDTAQPMFIKSFKKNRMPCQKFTKDVMGGIESIRKVVVDSANRRRLKVIKTPENSILIDGFNHHHFKTDAAGNITQDPDDEGFADVMDSLRYIGQNLFGLKKTTSLSTTADAMTTYERDLLQQRYQASRQNIDTYNRKTLQEHANTLTGEEALDSRGGSGSAGVIWDFSDDLDET